MVDKVLITELNRLSEQMRDVLEAKEHGDAGLIEHNGWEPASDICFSGDALVIELELPGFGIEDIRLSLERGVLRVEGERRRKAGCRMLRSERAVGPFCRAFSLPPEVATKELEVDFERGLLRISIPAKDVVSAAPVQLGSKT